MGTAQEGKFAYAIAYMRDCFHEPANELLHSYSHCEDIRTSRYLHLWRPLAFVGVACLLTAAASAQEIQASFRGSPNHLGLYDSPAPGRLSLKWTFKTAGPIVSSPSVVGDAVYVGSADKSLYALDAATGRLRWKFDLGAKFRRLRSRLGPPKAITAMARTLAILFYRMLKFGQDYVDRGTEFYEQRQRDQQLQYLQKKAAHLGFQVVALPDTP